MNYRMPRRRRTSLRRWTMLWRYTKTFSKDTSPKNVAFFGTSAGGALTLEMVLRARAQGLPVPGAIAPGTPMSDVTKHGDTFYTNEKVDNILVSRDGFCDAATVIYAQGHDLADPLLSPVNGDMHGFPPTILTTGTRDLLLTTRSDNIGSCAGRGSKRNWSCSRVSRMRNTSSTTEFPRPRKPLAKSLISSASTWVISP